MNDENWSDRELSRAIARRLCGRSSPATAGQASTSEYTPLSALSALERLGLASERSSRGDEREGDRAPAHGSSSDGQHSASRDGANPASNEVAEGLLAFDVERLESLEMLLVWVKDCASAMSAFLLDAEGGVIERVGEWESETAEATGARVLLAIERLGSSDRPTVSPRVLNIEYEGYWLAAIPVGAGHGEIHILCIVTASVLSPAKLEHISKAVATGVLFV